MRLLCAEHLQEYLSLQHAIRAGGVERRAATTKTWVVMRQRYPYRYAELYQLMRVQEELTP